MAEDRFVVERAAEYSVAPQYRPSVVESHLSKYVLEVDVHPFLIEVQALVLFRIPLSKLPLLFV